MDSISTILGHVAAIISSASTSKLALGSLLVVGIIGIVALFFFLTARTNPVLSFVVLALISVLGSAAFARLVPPRDAPKPATGYDMTTLKTVQNIRFKIPSPVNGDTSNYQLRDGELQREPDGTWLERQFQDGGFDPYKYEAPQVTDGRLDYRRVDGSVELHVDFAQHLICYRVHGASGYRCPYAVVQFE